MSRQYSDTCPATTLVGPGGGSATGLTNVATTMELSASIAGFLAVPFLLRLEPGTVNEELVLCTAGAGSSGSPYTILRAQGTTTAKAHASATTVTHGVSSVDISPNYPALIVSGTAVGASSTAEVSAGDVATIAANEGQIGTTYNVFVWGTNAFGVSSTLTFRIRLGGLAGVLIGSVPAVTPTGAGGWILDFSFTVRSAGASATVNGGGSLTIDALTGPAITPATSGAVDLTTSKTVTLTAQFSASNAGNNVQITGGYIQRYL